MLEAPAALVPYQSEVHPTLGRFSSLLGQMAPFLDDSPSLSRDFSYSYPKLREGRLIPKFVFCKKKNLTCSAIPFGKSKLVYHFSDLSWSRSSLTRSACSHGAGRFPGDASGVPRHFSQQLLADRVDFSAPLLQRKRPLIGHPP